MSIPNKKGGWRIVMVSLNTYKQYILNVHSIAKKDETVVADLQAQRETLGRIQEELKQLVEDPVRWYYNDTHVHS